MIRYSDRLVQRIRTIRVNERPSYAQLSRKYKIPSGTIRNWCHEDGLSRKDALTKTYQIRREALKNSEITCVPNINSLSKKQAKLFAGLLYGCEGSKYPSTSRMAFTNSDPNLIAAFFKLLKKGFDIDKNKLTLHLQIHSDQSYLKLKKYWLKKLELSNVKFIKPTITSPLGGKHRSIYIGTCTIRYSDYRLQLKLLGIFEKFTEGFSLGQKAIKAV